jgi:signal transduction histidine kinase
MTTEPFNILLVDDIPDNLIVLEAVLRRPDIRLVTARSGSEALELCLTHEFSLALLDVQMPEMDGFELAELMRGAERTKHVPIIFVTAGARDQKRTFKGYELGAVDFLYKPVETQILTSKVDVFIDLARQRRQLAQSLQLNEMFVGILGHDLRNPLNAVFAGLDLLSSEQLSETGTQTVERMARATTRMENMITELLDLTYARLAPGLGLARTREELDLRELLGRTIDELRAAHHREIVLEGPACTASGDAERLLQLFSNLLGNAIVHGTENTPITARIADASEEAIVEVHNHGAIPRELADTLFEPFHSSRKKSRTGRGLGLGLYIAQQIARAHGGRVEVASSEGDGTRFTVHLPRAATPMRPAVSG